MNTETDLLDRNASFYSVKQVSCQVPEADCTISGFMTDLWGHFTMFTRFPVSLLHQQAHLLGKSCTLRFLDAYFKISGFMTDLNISQSAAEARAAAEANANVEAEARAAAEKAAAEKVILRDVLPPSEDRAVGKNVAYALLDNTGLQQSSSIDIFFTYSYVCVHTYIYT